MNIQTTNREETAALKRQLDRLKRENANLQACLARAEQEQREYAAMRNSSAGAWFLVDRNYRILNLNDYGQSLSKHIWGKQANKGDSLLEFCAPGKEDSFKAHVGKAYAGETLHLRMPLTYPNGETIYYDIQYAPVYSNDGEIWAITFLAENITEAYERDLALQESEARFRELANDGTAMMWMTGVAGELVFLSENWKSFLGVQSLDAFKNLDKFAHPDDLTQLEAEIWQSVNQNTRFQTKVRLLEASGRYVHVNLQGRPRLDSHGEFLGMIGSATNLDAVYQRKAHLELLSLVAENTKDNILITGPDRRIEWANQAFMRDTGYTWSEIVGKSPAAILQGPTTDPETAKILRDRLRANLDVDIEIQNHRKNGETFWSHLIIDPVHNERGEVVRFISVQRDITTQKRLAEQLQNTSKRLLQTTIDSQEEERKRIANELHDGIGVLLSAASMRLSLLHDLKPEEVTKTDFDGKILQVEDMFRDAVTEVRAVSHNMHPPSLELLGLATALEHFFRRIGESTQLCLHLALERNTLNTYGRREALLIYRVCQEIMHNAIKHAKATCFSANVFFDDLSNPGRVFIILEDNGVGIRIADWQKSKGLGYGSIMSRIQLLNGSCRVSRLKSGGTRFVIELPTAE